MPIVKRICNFTEFVTAVNDLEKDTYRQRYVFRGEPRYDGFKKWELTPKIFRKNTGGNGEERVYRESALVDAVVSRYPGIFKDCKSNLEILLLMQHYGLPTRLLDVSFNPYIALFFAFSSKSSESTHYVYIIDTEKIAIENSKDEKEPVETKKIPNTGWLAQKNVFDNTLAVISALSRLTKEEQGELQELKKGYEAMKKSLAAFVESQSIVASSSGITVSDFVKMNIKPDQEALDFLNNYKIMQRAFYAVTESPENYKEIYMGILYEVIENSSILQTLVNKIKYYHPGFDQTIIFEDMNNDYIVRPHFSNDRIKNQNGGFLLLNALDDTHHVNEEYIKEVWEIKFETTDYDTKLEEWKTHLRYMGIDQNFIYPELEKFIHEDYLEVLSEEKRQEESK